MPEILRAVGFSVSDGLRNLRFRMGTKDIIAIGVVILAIGAVLVAAIVALGLVFGKVQGSTATPIIIGCVGGSAIGGIVAALVGKNPKGEKKNPFMD